MKKIDLQVLASRSEAINQFDVLLNGEIKILTFRGFAGIGKTELIKWLKKYKCNKKEIISAFVDLSYISAEGCCAEFMETIINSFAEFIPSEQTEKFDNKREKYYEALIKSSQNIEQHIINGNSNQLEIETNLNKRIMLAKEALSNVFINCLKYIKNEIAVVFIDCYEHISASDQEFIGKLLNKLVSRNLRVRIVIASQDSLSYNPESFNQFDVLPLNCVDSKLYLEFCGINDKEFQSIVYEKLAKGNFKITQFAIEAWKQAECNGYKLDLDNISQLIEQNESIKWIFDKIINHLDEPIGKLIRKIVVLREFNLENINCFISSEANKIGVEDFYGKIVNLSFIEKVQDRRILGERPFFFTKHFRRILFYSFSRDEPQEFIETHRLAYDMFKESDDNINAIYHLFFINKAEAIEEWNSLRSEAKTNKNFTLVNKLFEIAQSEEIKLSNVQKAVVWSKKAHYLRQIGNLDDSEKAYKKALDIFDNEQNGWDNDFLRTKHGYAVLSVLKGKCDVAKRELNILLEFNDKDTYSLNMLASIELIDNNYEAARNILKESIKIDSDNIFTISFLAQIDIETENWIAAIEYLENAYNKFPYEIGIIHKLARAYQGRSIDLLNQAHLIDPEDQMQKDRLQALTNEFKILASGGHIEDARSRFSEIMSINSSYSDILERWARSEQKRENYQKAFVLYKIHLDYHPENKKALFSYGWLEFAKGDRKIAEEQFRKSLNIDSKQAQVWFYLGEVKRLEIRNNSEAARCYKEAYEVWIENNQYYNHILIEDEDGYDESEIEIDPEDSKMGYKILWQWSKTEYRLGNLEKGRELYEKLYKITYDRSKCMVLARWAINEYEHQNYDEGDFRIGQTINCLNMVENIGLMPAYLESFLSPKVGKVTPHSMNIARNMAESSSYKAIANIVLSRLYRKTGMLKQAREVFDDVTANFPGDPNVLSEIKRLKEKQQDTF